MKIPTLSPWAKSALTPREYRILRDLPQPGYLNLTAHGPRGGYVALYSNGGPSARAEHPSSPFIAAERAIEKGVAHE